MRNERGQSTVELALSMLVLVMLLFGLVDFGRVFHAYLTLDHAGREAARAAITGKSDTEIEAVVTNRIAGLDETKLQVSIAPVEADRVRGVDTTISLTYDIKIITPIIANIFPQNPFPLKTKTIMRMEN